MTPSCRAAKSRSASTTTCMWRGNSGRCSRGPPTCESVGPPISDPASVPARVVDAVTPIGDGFSVQGNFRTFIALQGLAVDTSRTASRGNVYVTWHDGRFRSQPDPVGGCDGARYCFGDALLARSTNNGNNWATAVRVNDDDIRRGIDQIFPALDVDSSGTVWVGFYDRRWDDRNFLLDFVVARSTNRGATFSNTRATRQFVCSGHWVAGPRSQPCLYGRLLGRRDRPAGGAGCDHRLG